MTKDIKTFLNEQVAAEGQEHAWVKGLIKNAAHGIMTTHTPEEKAVEKLITLPGGWHKSDKFLVSANNFPKEVADELAHSLPHSVKKQLRFVPIHSQTTNTTKFIIHHQRLDELAEQLGFVKPMFIDTGHGQTR